jgi:hypothetical protein
VTLREISIRMYDVGWGDCFLLRFAYQRGAHRHVLIDFGTTASSPEEERERLMPVAEDIREHCGGKLDAVVATHRHRDHIGGFAALKRRVAPGNVIARLSPDLVIQPWTESPRHQSLHAKALMGMDHFALALPNLVEAMGEEFSLRDRSQLLAMARQNYPNRQAVESLAKLGRRRVYASTGSRTGLEALLPGFSVRVLGPARRNSGLWPDLLLDQARETWRRFSWRSRDWADDHQARRPLFPDAPHWHPAMAPPRMRWFISQVNRMRADQVMQLARAAHTEINNSSLVLLIEGFGHRLLFPGDVELRGWASVLRSPATRDALRDVTLYKASHHGAGNGTPRSVWALIGRGAAELRTMVSRSPAALDSDRRFLEQMALESGLTDTAQMRHARRPYADIHLGPSAPPVKLVA